jgi:hypothetical protein
MAKQIDSRIEEYAYDCTIGAGRGADDQDAPRYHNFEDLYFQLGRTLSDDEIFAFCECWRKNQQMMEQQ